MFPSRDSLIRLIGAVLADQSDEWTEGRRYVGLELLAKSRIRIFTTEPDPASESTVTNEALTANLHQNHARRRSCTPPPRTWPTISGTARQPSGAGADPQERLKFSCLREIAGVGWGCLRANPPLWRNPGLKPIERLGNCRYLSPFVHIGVDNYRIPDDHCILK
jgi:hypothetical protein